MGTSHCSFSTAVSVYEVPLRSLTGETLDLRRLGPRGLLVVNVASECGLTPQYAALQAVHESYRERGFSVLGVPCNQFGGQEPGAPAEILTFCETNYSVDFPLTEKLDVNGETRHQMYALLCPAVDDHGDGGDVQWNFEKFVVGADGFPVARFRPSVVPDDVRLTNAIEQILL